MDIQDIERITTNPKIQSLMALAAELNQAAWLVGGCLRDALLGLEPRDFDIAHTGPPEILPFRFARAISGTCFWLDKDRGHARVVDKSAKEALTFDFAPVQGSGICQDLSLRDFTINAMALPLLHGVCCPIDPLGGSADLQDKLIRHCSANTFSDDPLRLLRAYRFAILPGFSIDSKTSEAISRQANLLCRVARERIRDEFFRILSAEPHRIAMAALHRFNLLPLIIPAADDICTELGLLEVLERLHGELDRLLPADSLPVRNFLNQQTEHGITRLALLRLATLLSGRRVRNQAQNVANGLRLGNKSTQVLDDFLSSPMKLASLERPNDPASIFRICDTYRNAGPAIALLPLAMGLINKEEFHTLTTYRLHQHKDPSSPLLLSGSEIATELGIKPGPAIGQALEKLRQCESLGQIDNKAAARSYIQKILLTTGEPIS